MSARHAAQHDDSTGRYQRARENRNDEKKRGSIHARLRPHEDSEDASSVIRLNADDTVSRAMEIARKLAESKNEIVNEQGEEDDAQTEVDELY